MAVRNIKLKDNQILWTDISSPTKEELEEVSESYNLNPYALIDSLDPDHLPKYETHNDIHFFIIRILHKSANDNELTVKDLSSKIAVFFNSNFIITIHRFAQPIIDDIREKCLKSGGVETALEIALQIVSKALSSYEIPAIEISDEIDYYESKVFLKKNVPNDLIEGIYYLKRKAGLSKKLLLLTNEVLNSLKVGKSENPALQDARDLHLKLLTLYDQAQEDAHNLLNIYLSISARKTNDVMKILTIFSVFFMPLTFIAGIYGMNFDYMPELNAKLGYPLTLLAMAIVSAVIFIWFRRKKWL